MIFNIYIDGFKSLTDFNLQINKGLNILVGPNGAGKTNLISFFDFLNYLNNNSVANAVSKSGGAGVIFTKAGEDFYKPVIKCQIKGSTKLSSNFYLYYDYSFEINLKPEHQHSIIYKYQSIKYKFRSVDTNNNSRRVTKFDLDVESVFDEKHQKLNYKVNSLNSKKIHVRTFSAKKENKITFQHFLNEHLSKSVDDPLIRLLSTIVYDGIDNILADLDCGLAYNIEPSKVRITDDSANPPGINPDGSGLYSTLYFCEKFSDNSQMHLFRRFVRRTRLVKQVSIDEILSFVRVANKAIKRIDVVNDPFDNNLTVRVEVEGMSNLIGDNVIDINLLPLSSMSDGTLKWICLITILLTSNNIISIEEPENYLHPLMQSEILNITRDTLSDDRFILMSTHSETILNKAKPEEIVIVNYEQGKTKAYRPDNVEIIKDEIKRTGFGLGYYYLTGILEDE